MSDMCHSCFCTSFIASATPLKSRLVDLGVSAFANVRDVCPILTVVLFQRTFSHACPQFSLSRLEITWSRARPSLTCHGASTDICLIRVTFDIAVIVLMIFLPGWSNGAYILFVANYITIFGIVFATVWTTNLNWIMRRMVEAGVDARTQSTMRFQGKSIADALSMYDPYSFPDLVSPT